MPGHIMATMTNQEAHALLNLAKLGGRVTPQQIQEALIVTGDMAPPKRDYQQPEQCSKWVLAYLANKAKRGKQ